MAPLVEQLAAKVKGDQCEPSRNATKTPNGYPTIRAVTGVTGIRRGRSRADPGKSWCHATDTTGICVDPGVGSLSLASSLPEGCAAGTRGRAEARDRVPSRRCRR